MIMRTVNRSELTLIKVHKDDREEKLKWKHDKEFELNQTMYDIVDSDQIEDTLYFWTWKDDKETSLERDLEALLGIVLQSDEDKNRGEQCVEQFFKASFLSVQSKGIWLAPANHFQWRTEEPKTILQFSDPLVPPPRLG